MPKVNGKTYPYTKSGKAAAAKAAAKTPAKPKPVSKTANRKR